MSEAKPKAPRGFRAYLVGPALLGRPWRGEAGEVIEAAAVMGVITTLAASPNEATRAKMRVLTYFQFREINPDFLDWCEAEGISEATAYRWRDAAVGLVWKYMGVARATAGGVEQGGQADAAHPAPEGFTVQSACEPLRSLSGA